MVSDIGAAMEEAEELARMDVRAGSPARPSGSATGTLRDGTTVRTHAGPVPRVIVPDAEAPPPPEGMCVVPAGIFMFGESKQPRYLPDYFIDRYPVTNEEFEEFVRETGHRPPRFWSGKKPPAGKADHPVVGITFEDATAFARWAGKDLPTEEEWEKAARGTDGRTYPWGDLFSPEKSNVSGTGIKDTSSIRRFESSVSVYGCTDMAGNVWEWTKSEYQSAGTNRALKGGSWYDFSTYARCASRFSAPPDYEGNSVGFRCVYRVGRNGQKPPRPRRVPGSNRNRGEPETAPPDADPKSSPRRVEPDRATPPETAPSGPLRNLVEVTVGAFDDFNLHAAKVRMEEVLGVPDTIPSEPAGIGRPELAPELELPTPAGRWGRWLGPAARGIRFLMPYGYRLGHGIDAFFHRAPRWLSMLVILIIPLSTIGLVVFASDRQAPVSDAAARAPVRVERPPASPRSEPAAERFIPYTVGAEVAKGPEPKGAAEGTAAPIEPPPGMVGVPAGVAVVGREGRRVELPAFFIDAYEATNLDYQKFVDATGYPPPAHWIAGRVPPGLEHHPVTNVDYADACAYANWSGKRLPTEEEWEKAARGPEGRRFPWGNEPDPSRANLFLPASQMMGTREVGSTPAGMSPYGCHDMAGNVLEWTATRHGENYVLKGGSWGLSRENGACHFRYVFFPPETRTPMVGFRCVKDPPSGGGDGRRGERP